MLKPTTSTAWLIFSAASVAFGRPGGSLQLAAPQRPSAGMRNWMLSLGGVQIALCPCCRRTAEEFVQAPLRQVEAHKNWRNLHRLHVEWSNNKCNRTMQLLKSQRKHALEGNSSCSGIAQL